MMGGAAQVNEGSKTATGLLLLLLLLVVVQHEFAERPHIHTLISCACS
jgi:hypothetical protein